MKLSYYNSSNGTKYGVVCILIFFLLIIIAIHISVLKLKMHMNTIIIFIEILTISCIIYQIYSIKREKNIINHEMWRNGKKCQGYIVETGYIRMKYHYHGYNSSEDEGWLCTEKNYSYMEEKVPYSNQNTSDNVIDYYITVFYDNLYYIDIKSIKYNDAYILLGMLLNPYPIKEKIEIPIDIYIYKNKVYADLDSINFKEIRGYEECKRIIEKTYAKDKF